MALEGARLKELLEFLNGVGCNVTPVLGAFVSQEIVPQIPQNQKNNEIAPKNKTSLCLADGIFRRGFASGSSCCLLSTQ